MSWTTSDTKSRARSVVQILARQLMAYKIFIYSRKSVQKSVYTVNWVERWFCQNFHQRFSKSALKSAYTENWVVSWLFENFYQIFSNITSTRYSPILVLQSLYTLNLVANLLSRICVLTLASFCIAFRFTVNWEAHACARTHTHIHQHTYQHAHTNKTHHIRVGICELVWLYWIECHTHTYTHTHAHTLSLPQTHTRHLRFSVSLLNLMSHTHAHAHAHKHTHTHTHTY